MAPVAGIITHIKPTFPPRDEMPRNTQPTRVPVPPDLAEALEGLAVDHEGQTVSVGDLIEVARNALDAVNGALEGNDLTHLVVKELMRKGNRRGQGSIKVDGYGRMILSLGEPDGFTIAHTTAPGGAGLPSLKTLRAIAEQRGVDIADLGRRKREIMKRLAVGSEPQSPSEDRPPERLRDEVRTSTPLPMVKLPR